MPYFITRVELHDANYADYQRLHVAMESHGFSRTVEVGGKRQQLPTAEYFHGDSAATQAVLTKAEAAAASTLRRFAILVSHVADGLATGLAPA